VVLKSGKECGTKQGKLMARELLITNDEISCLIVNRCYVSSFCEVVRGSEYVTSEERTMSNELEGMWKEEVLT
jgi:hypothetical protein